MGRRKPRTPRKPRKPEEGTSQRKSRRGKTRRGKTRRRRLSAKAMATPSSASFDCSWGNLSSRSATAVIHEDGIHLQHTGRPRNETHIHFKNLKGVSKKGQTILTVSVWDSTSKETLRFPDDAALDRFEDTLSQKLRTHDTQKSGMVRVSWKNQSAIPAFFEVKEDHLRLFMTSVSSEALPLVKHKPPYVFILKRPRQKRKVSDASVMGTYDTTSFMNFYNSNGEHPSPTTIIELNQPRTINEASQETGRTKSKEDAGDHTLIFPLNTPRHYQSLTLHEIPSDTTHHNTSIKEVLDERLHHFKDIKHKDYKLTTELYRTKKRVAGVRGLDMLDYDILKEIGTYVNAGEST